MRTSITDNGITFALTGAEALILAEELSDVPGGSKLRKVRQLHDELREALVWVARGAGGYSHEAEEAVSPYTPPRRGRPPNKLRLVDDSPGDEEDPFLAFVRSRLPGQK